MAAGLTDPPSCSPISSRWQKPAGGRPGLLFDRLGGRPGLLIDPNDGMIEIDKLGEEGYLRAYGDHLTPAERRYLEQRAKIDMRRLAKIANKSNHDRIQEFNQYLANLSEHYDIPKVGPG